MKAISVNPLDAKECAPKDKVETAPRILGWDAGVVAVGDAVTTLKPGDEVYYAADITRSGSDSEFHYGFYNNSSRVNVHNIKFLNGGKTSLAGLISIPTHRHTAIWRLLLSKNDRSCL